VAPALRGRHDKIAVRITAHGEAAALCRLWAARWCRLLPTAPDNVR
jgi:hypothetical protein